MIADMNGKKWGRVIAMNSECAMQNTPNQSAYVSGKRSMDGVLRCLAREVGEHGITVNQVAPGWTISDKYRGTDQERQSDYEKGGIETPHLRKKKDRPEYRAVGLSF